MAGARQQQETQWRKGTTSKSTARPTVVVDGPHRGFFSQAHSTDFTLATSVAIPASTRARMQHTKPIWEEQQQQPHSDPPRGLVHTRSEPVMSGARLTSALHAKSRLKMPRLKPAFLKKAFRNDALQLPVHSCPALALSPCAAQLAHHTHVPAGPPPYCFQMSPMALRSDLGTHQALTARSGYTAASGFTGLGTGSPPRVSPGRGATSPSSLPSPTMHQVMRVHPHLDAMVVAELSRHGLNLESVTAAAMELTQLESGYESSQHVHTN